MISRLKAIYHRLPYRIRNLFVPVKLLGSLVYYLRVDHWLLTGEEKSEGNRLVVSYAGREWNKNYFVSLAFRSAHSEKYLGKKWLWQVNSKRPGTEQPVSLSVLEIPRNLECMFRNKRDFRIPNMIILEIKIPENVAAFLDYGSVTSPLLVMNKSLKSDLTRIKKNGLSFEVTGEISRLDEFFNEMYLPYIGKVHNDRAVYVGTEWLLQKYKNPELLFVKKGEERLGGIVLNYKNNKGHLLLLGIQDGNTDFVREGVIGALYYYSFCHIQSKGYDTAVLGGTRPFLEDGILRYKKKWGARITRSYDRRFLLRVVSNGSGTKGFLKNNPFVFTRRSRLSGAVFFDDGAPLNEYDERSLYSRYFCEGADELCVFRLDDNGPEPEWAARTITRTLTP